jgi:hypothetical protein
MYTYESSTQDQPETYRKARRRAWAKLSFFGHSALWLIVNLFYVPFCWNQHYELSPIWNQVPIVWSIGLLCHYLSVFVFAKREKTRIWAILSFCVYLVGCLVGNAAYIYFCTSERLETRDLTPLWGIVPLAWLSGVIFYYLSVFTFSNDISDKRERGLRVSFNKLMDKLGEEELQPKNSSGKLPTDNNWPAPPANMHKSAQ